MYCCKHVRLTCDNKLLLTYLLTYYIFIFILPYFMTYFRRLCFADTRCSEAWPLITDDGGHVKLGWSGFITLQTLWWNIGSENRSWNNSTSTIRFSSLRNSQLLGKTNWYCKFDNLYVQSGAVISILSFSFVVFLLVVFVCFCSCATTLCGE